MEAASPCVCGRLSTEIDETTADEIDWQLQIECDICHIWFHARCVKLGKISVKTIDKYHCPKCEPLCGPSILRPRTNEHRHDYTEENAETKSTQVGTKAFVQQIMGRIFTNATDPGGVVDTVDSGKDLTLPYLSTSGFSRPILIPEPDGLGLSAPDDDFILQDVPSSVGDDRNIDVIDVHSQEAIVMNIREFCEAFETPVEDRPTVLNCLSLEVTNLPLGDVVMPPLVARMLCWVTNVWPQSIQEQWEGGEPPQVQKYCIMSMQGAFTDFHIDFGGTSVWYHIFKGQKIFYLIEPTSVNLSLYERWQRLSGQSETFLGDMVDKCYKIAVTEGQTLFIPTGWIHAVLTTEDSLVFGGNFLHSLNIQLQLKVYQIEERIKTHKKFKFPHFEEVNWLAAQKLKNDLSDLNSDSTLCPSHLLSGIKALLTTLKSWLPDIESRTCPPSIDPQKLVRELAKELRLAEKVTLKWNPPKPERESKRKKQKKGLQADFIDISRGNAFLFLGGRVSKTKKKPIVKPKKEVAAPVAQKSPKTPKKVAKGGGAKVAKEPKDSKKTPNTPSPKKGAKVPKEPKEPKEKPKKVPTKAVSKKVPKDQAKKVKPPKEPKVKTTAPKTNKVNKVKKTSEKIKIVPKKRKLDELQDEEEGELEKRVKKEENDNDNDNDVTTAEENFNFKFKNEQEQRTPSPQHIKLKLPMSALAPTSFDLTDRDAVRQLMSNQRHHMRQLDSALGDVMADFEEEEDLIIDEKKDPDIPIKLKLSIGGQRSRPPTSPKKSLKAVIRNRSKAMEDFDMTKVHQDDDYIYPSLELSDDEMEVGPSVHIAKDDAWTPKVKVRGSPEKMERAARSKKVAAVEAGLKQAAEKKRKKPKANDKKVQPINISTSAVISPVNHPSSIPVQMTASLPVRSILQPTKSSLLMNTGPSGSATSTLEAVKLSLSRSESNASLSNKKPKKGQSTAKQRLGKILKLKF